MDMAPRPPGRRGRRWSFDAAIPLMTPPVKSTPHARRNRSSSVVGPESIFIPPPLVERHGSLHHLLQKNWRKFQQRRNSSSHHKDFIILASMEDGSTEIVSCSYISLCCVVYVFSLINRAWVRIYIHVLCSKIKGVGNF